MTAKLTGEPIPQLSGANFSYKVGQTSTAVPGICESIATEGDDCPNTDCGIIPFCSVNLQERTVKAGALCTNACRRLPEVVARINANL